MTIDDKNWVKQSALKMSDKELADNILLFLQHTDSPSDNEAELAGYKIFLWADNQQTKEKQNE